VKKNNIAKNFDSKATKWILFALFSITLYFNPKVQDPFNAPKFWLLLVIGGWLSGYAIHYSWLSRKNFLESKFTIFCIIFFILLLLNVVFAEDRYTAIFGEYQRKNGFLSYIFLTILMITASFVFTSKNIGKLFVTSTLISIILVIYGNLQASGIDFVNWNNPYNAVIATLGNPNFSAATMAILGTLVFGYIAMQTKVVSKIFIFIIFLLLLFTIYQTDARQGLISIAIGVSFIVVFMVFSRSRKIGITVIAISIPFILLSVLGMLQKGPLVSLLYKDSVTVRGYYWRAGIKMFEENPFFGVGLDNYGDHFKEFREVGYPLKYGFDITSSAAHNVYIQMLSTGGIFLGLFYLILNIFVLIFGIKSIKNLEKPQKITQVTLIAAFLAFIAQSVVSIDNLGIAVWGWVLMGAIIGIGKSPSEGTNYFRPDMASNKISLFQNSLSGIFGLSMLILCVFLYRGEHNMYIAAGFYNPAVQNQREPFYQYTKQTIETPLIDPRHKLTSGMYLVSFGFVDEGMSLLKQVNAENPRNLDALNVLAEYLIQLGKFDEAIKYRQNIARLDPWNAKNYLALGSIYKQVNDVENMNLVLKEIESFAKNSQIYQDAKSQLVLG